MNKVVAIIPAREGSKRLPCKNKKMFCGKPLIAWTIETALNFAMIDEVLISSDDLDILRISSGYFDISTKLKFIQRPKHLCQDNTMVWEVVQHACSGYDDDTIIILLQPTSPLRTLEDLESVWQLFKDGQCQHGVVSGFWEYPSHYIHINGAIYLYYLSDIIENKNFMSTGTIFYLMPKERSIDIDLQSDFDLAEEYMKRR